MRQKDRQADRQTDRDTERYRDRETEGQDKRGARCRDAEEIERENRQKAKDQRACD